MDQVLKDNLVELFTDLNSMLMSRMHLKELKLNYQLKFGDFIIEMKLVIFQLLELIEINIKIKLDLLLFQDLVY